MTQVERLLDQAEQRVWLMVYVLRPGRNDDGPVHRLVAALARAQERGCEVKVVLDQSKAYRSEELDPKHLAGAAMLQQHGLTVLIDEVRTRSTQKCCLSMTRSALLAATIGPILLSAQIVNRASCFMTAPSLNKSMPCFVRWKALIRWCYD